MAIRHIGAEISDINENDARSDRSRAVAAYEITHNARGRACNLLGILSCTIYTAAWYYASDHAAKDLTGTLRALYNTEMFTIHNNQLRNICCLVAADSLNQQMPREIAASYRELTC